MKTGIFVKRVAATRLFIFLAICPMMWVMAMEPKCKPQDEPLLDWTCWQKYRSSIVHPAALIKPSDLARARANLEWYRWAQQYRDNLESNAKAAVGQLTPEFLAQMIPSTTPGDTLFTPCPACRDLDKHAHPHGQWRWSAKDPDKLVCAVCATVFPNEKYPEEIVFQTRYGGGQTLTFCGGEPFKLFGYVGRPSFTANIRAQKIGYITSLLRTLAEAWALTGRAEYARAARLILLRLADVYPNWLVHTGYGEYADMDPHIAALNINALPDDEICPPPNKPDRRLHSGYWQGGRARGTGMEGSLVRHWVEAYEFVCTATDQERAIFSNSDRLKIEKDLLLESTVLLVADKSINNKSVTNATAAALVGVALGHPGMVRFGLDVFMKTVDGWFLPDGGTSESWSYATMTLSGIESLGQAFRGYSDPPGYTDVEGKRIEKLDLYHDTVYGRVWAAMFNGLQGDLFYPPLADGHRSSNLASNFAELMAVNYPENSQYLALLKALAGDDLSRGYPRYALYYREPGLEKKPTPPLCFHDYVFPVLQIGYLRSGPTGRDSALILSASDWGGHHHLDSLSLYYWKDKRELLSDLGYLWDHPMSLMTRRTFAHNTVIVDGKDQITKGRGGKFTLFESRGQVKVMEAESRAYPLCSLYRRTVAQVEFAPGRQYVADIFRVQGGATHDYVFHGPSNDMKVIGAAMRPSNDTVFDLKNVRTCDAPGIRTLAWKMDDKATFTAIWPNVIGELTIIGDGWGQRDYRNSDVGATLPYIVRRCKAGKVLTVFVTVFEAHPPDAPHVKSIEILPTSDSEAGNCVAMLVQTQTSSEYLVSCLEARPLKLDVFGGHLEVNARFATLSIRDGKPISAALVEGTLLRWNGEDVPILPPAK